jgi:hypothetical protein
MQTLKLAKETTRKFNETKTLLEAAVYRWEKLNEELTAIESQFS